MRRQLLVAGTGRMGLDAGLFFLRRGWRVTWLCGDPARREEFARRIDRESRRIADAPGDDAADAARVLLFDEAGDLGGSAPELFLEAVREDLEQKRRVFGRVAPLLPAPAVLATVSSSLLPEQIHPRCVGAHSFFPLEMTRLVEAIAPRDGGERGLDALLAILRGAGVHAIVQRAANAFAVNRLLLPLQAAAVRALRAGWPAALVDRASATPLVPFGQLALMDAVGLDVIAPAVENYRSRLPPEAAQQYAELVDTLGALVAAGKRGKKNRDGFLAGAPLPWPPVAPSPLAVDELARDFRALAAQTCARAVAAGEIAAEQIDLAFSSLFPGAAPLAEELRGSWTAAAAR
jgi:3-hydroxybutyryl-CoA dehydrogenase